MRYCNSDGLNKKKQSFKNVDVSLQASNKASKGETLCVVIPTKNRNDDLLLAVRSVLSQARMPDELVIVDQSVSNSADEMIHSLLVHYKQIEYKYIFDNTLSGLTAAKNVAIKIAASDIICFIDDDIVMEKNFIWEILDVYKRIPSLSGVGGIAQLPEGKQVWLRRFIAPLFQIGPFYDIRILLQYGYMIDKDIIPSRFLSGGCSALRRELFEHVQFNEILVGASPVEDLDFYLRVAPHFKFAIACKAIAAHNISPVARSGLCRSYELKCLGFAHIFYSYMPKTPFNFFAFLWRNVGFVLDAVEKSVSYKTLDPFRGIIRGWKKVFNHRITP